MTANALLSAVLANPFDDGPRLVYADWLEENVEPERAEFIRDNIQQCDRCSPHLYDADNTYGIGYHPERDPASGRHEGGWTNCKSCNGGGSGGIRKRFTDHDNEILKKVVYIVRRGFVDEIRCTMAQWVGGICQTCGGNGSVDSGRIGSFREIPIRIPETCKTCKGQCRTPGIEKAVCEKWPVTRIVFPEMEPVLVDGIDDEFSGRWIWWMGSYETFDSNQRNELPGFLNPVWPDVWAFDSRAEALAALSLAAVNYGRRLAGLPELKQR